MHRTRVTVAWRPILNNAIWQQGEQLACENWQQSINRMQARETKENKDWMRILAKDNESFDERKIKEHLREFVPNTYISSARLPNRALKLLP